MQQGRINISILVRVCIMSNVVYFCCLRSVTNDNLITSKMAETRCSMQLLVSERQDMIWMISFRYGTTRDGAVG
jgi:hypothetical protein